LNSARLASVSTVIPAYNAERTIAQTLESVLAQDWPNHEVVVVNDGSTDRTAAILGKFRGQIRIIDCPNQGAAPARNTGVARSSGKYIAFLDSDDVWLPGKLRAMVPALERNPTATLAFSEYINVSESGVEFEPSGLGHAPSREEMMTSLPPILTSTWVLPRVLFEQIGGFSPAFRGGQGFEDSWFLLQLRELGEFIYVPEKLARYRIAAGAESADKYAHALRTFIGLTKAKYGNRGRGLVRGAKKLQCRWMLSKIAHQIDAGDRLGALYTALRIARLHPAYFLAFDFGRRLLLPQNRRRFRLLV
jgi:glycosyltransferase involved in cell wall biosynthesis